MKNSRHIFITLHNGQSLVEVLVAMGVFVLGIATVGLAVIEVHLASGQSIDRTQAIFLAREGIEAARSIWDDDWVNLKNGNHGIILAGNTWKFSGTSDVQDQFTRTITLEELDPKRKKITSKVTWQLSPDRLNSASFFTYLTHWQIGNWAFPKEETSMNISGTQDGLKIQVQGGYGYVVRAGGTPDFLVFSVADPAFPSLVASLDLPGTPVNIAVSGNYAYVASTHNSQELQIIDISVPSLPQPVGVYNASGASDGSGVYAIGTRVYLTKVSSAAHEFFIIDAVIPNSPVLLGSLDIGATGREVMVGGSYAYIATTHDSRELQIIDISSPSSPVLFTPFNLPGTSDGLSIAGFGNTMIVGRSNGEVFLIDVAFPSSPTVMSVFSAQSAVNDLSLGNQNDYVFLASDENTAEFQVIEIFTPSSPVLVGILNVSADLNGIAYDEYADRVFAAGEADVKEFLVFAPQ